MVDLVFPFHDVFFIFIFLSLNVMNKPVLFIVYVSKCSGVEF